MVDVSIIIVNYNTNELLKNCLDSVYKNTKAVNYEIIVIDNGSEISPKKLLEEKFPLVVKVLLDENIGFGRANNEGIKIANGKYVFLLNSDTVLLNNAIKLFFNFFEENNLDKRIGAIGGELLDESGNFIHSSYFLPSKILELKIAFERPLRIIFKKEIFRKNQELYCEDKYLFREVGYVTGADLFMPIDVLNTIGLFDPIFFMYFEETDLQKRMSNFNYKRLIIPNTKIIHLEGASFGKTKISEKKFLMIENSKFKYFKKHTPRILYFLFKIIYSILNVHTIFDTRISLGCRIKLVKIRIFT